MGALQLRPSSPARRPTSRPSSRSAPTNAGCMTAESGQRCSADWRASPTFAWLSGTPLTPRVAGDASDVARGTNGTLRADYNGARDRAGESHDRRILQHRGVLRSAARHVRHGGTQHHHRAGQSSAERPGVARHPPARDADADDPARRRTNLLNAVNYARRRRGGQLADVRPGAVRPADALAAAQRSGSASDAPAASLPRSVSWS